MHNRIHNSLKNLSETMKAKIAEMKEKGAAGQNLSPEEIEAASQAVEVAMCWAVTGLRGAAALRFLSFVQTDTKGDAAAVATASNANDVSISSISERRHAKELSMVRGFSVWFDYCVPYFMHTSVICLLRRTSAARRIQLAMHQAQKKATWKTFPKNPRLSGACHGPLMPICENLQAHRPPAVHTQGTWLPRSRRSR